MQQVSKKPPHKPDAVLQSVLARAATLLRVDDDGGTALAEGFQLVAYQPRQHYHGHADYHTGRKGVKGYNGNRGANFASILHWRLTSMLDANFNHYSQVSTVIPW